MQTPFPQALLTDDGSGGVALKTTASIIGDVTIIGTGLATEAKQDAEIALLTTIDSTLSSFLDTPLSDLATEATLVQIRTNTDELSSISTSTATTNAKLTDGTQRTQLVDDSNIEIGSVLIDSIGDYIVNGTITGQLKNINDRTTDINNILTANFDQFISSLALESGGNLESIKNTLNSGGDLFTEIQSINTSTSTLVGIDYALGATQTNGNQKTQIVDSLFAEIGSTFAKEDGGNLESINTEIAQLRNVNGNLIPPNSILVGGSDGTNIQPLKVETDGTLIVRGQNGALTDAATTSITAGGTSQEVFAANATRKYILIQNTSDTNMYVNFSDDADAASNSILLTANGGFYERGEGFIPNEQINIVCATTGKSFVAKQA